MSYNAQGLSAYKLNDPEFLRCIFKYDFVLICETWTSLSSSYDVQNYQSFPSHRVKFDANATRFSGGVILYVKDHLSPGVTVVKDDVPDIIWVKLDKIFFGLSGDIFLCLCYVLPSNSSYRAKLEFDILDQIMLDVSKFNDEYPNPIFLISGDMNGRTHEEHDYVEHDSVDHLPLPDDYIEDLPLSYTRSNQDKVINAQGRSVLDLCKMCNVRIANGRMHSDRNVGKFTLYTWNGASAVDMVLASPPLFTHIGDFEVLDPVMYSDHCPVYFELNTSREYTNTVQRRVEKMMWDDDKIHLYVDSLGGEASIREFDNMARIIDDNRPLVNDDNTEPVHLAVKYFTNGIRVSADPLFFKTFTPSAEKNINPNTSPPWADDEWKASKKAFFRSRDKVKRSPSVENLRSMSDCRRTYKNIARRKQNNHDAAETKKLTNARFSNVKLYWKLLSGKKTSKPSCPISTSDWYNHFLRLSNPEDDFFSADDDISSEVKNIMEHDMRAIYEELDLPISEEEIIQVVKRLKRSKSGGDDMLINELFIYGISPLSPYLVTLFNFIFDTGIFPDSWADGLLTPLHKKGNKSLPDNYRGITLLSVLGKIFTSVLNKRLDTWAEAYSIYIEAQNGFRRGRGTTDSIFILHQIINQFINKGKKLYAFFIDFSKAFDSIVHENLWFKLIKVGIRGKMFSIVHSMYACLKTRVINNGEKSNAFYCQLGVRQGECLSPFLFSMYLNDIEECLEKPGAGITIDHMKFLLLLYADDIVIFAESAESLQSTIDDLFIYCARWKLRINTSKSFIVVFKKGRMNMNQSWKYGDANIPIATRIKYLGLIFSSNGLSFQAQKTLSEQANKAIFSLQKKLSRFKNLKLSVMSDLFDKFISPILNYGCEAWGFHDARNIEKVHLAFFKRIMGVKRSTQDDFVYGCLGRVPMLIQRHYRIVKYWVQIVSGKKSLYVNYLYMASLNSIDTTTSNHNWARNVRLLLCNTGYADIWRAQGVFDPNAFCEAFKVRLYDIFRQEWSARISTTSKAKFFLAINNTHTFYSVLDIVEDQKHRKALSRLVGSSHSLGVETGRWTSPTTPLQDRKCRICNKIDDEYHFLLECKSYEHFRKKLIPSYFWKRPSMFKCKQLFTSDHAKTIKNLAKYVYCAFKMEPPP